MDFKITLSNQVEQMIFQSLIKTGKFSINSVPRGARTPDRQLIRLELYQLSYRNYQHFL
jgi:hypothetical protein